MDRFMDLGERVKKILERYYLCDVCLGRQFHELLPRIPNREKGRILRTYAIMNAILKKEELKFKKDEKCYLCENLFDKIESYVESLKSKLKEYEFNTFLIGSKIPPELICREEEFWEENGVDFCEALKSNFNREVGYRLRLQLKKKIKFENPDIMGVVDLRSGEVGLQISPLYVKGSYKKKQPKEKVQNIIEKILLKESKASEAIFYSVGRLEHNVITNCYRPFILVLKNPKKRRLGLDAIRRKINKQKSICVSKLSYSDKEEIEKMKTEKITASYLITIELNKKLDEKEIRKKLMSLKNRRVLQFLKRKTRNPYMRRIKVKLKNKKLIIDIESTVGFSVNSFLIGKSKPNLKNLLGIDFKIKEIILKKYRKMKSHEMYS